MERLSPTLPLPAGTVILMAPRVAGERLGDAQRWWWPPLSSGFWVHLPPRMSDCCLRPRLPLEWCLRSQGWSLRSRWPLASAVENVVRWLSRPLLGRLEPVFDWPYEWALTRLVELNRAGRPWVVAPGFKSLPGFPTAVYGPAGRSECYLRSLGWCLRSRRPLVSAVESFGGLFSKDLLLTADSCAACLQLPAWRVSSVYNSRLGA